MTNPVRYPTPGGPGTAGTSIRDHAAAYTARGWRVFALSATKTPLPNCAPCRAHHTTPDQLEACSCLTCHGFYAATTDMDRVDAMFMANPTRMLAIRTGHPSGIIVVDVDGDEGQQHAERLAAEGLLPPTLTARTGSGGTHLVYQHPGGRVPNSASKLAPHVDVRGDGGYIVAPPSAHPRTGRRYRWVNWGHPITAPPPELIARLRPPPPQPAPKTAYITPPHHAHRRLAGAINTLLNARVGERNNVLYWASCVAAELAAAGHITTTQAMDALLPAALHTGLPEPEARRTITSALRRAQGGDIDHGN